MQSTRESMAEIRKEQELQTLYRLIEVSIESLKAEHDSQLAVISEDFRKNFVFILRSLVEVDGVSPFLLTKLLVPFINKILTAQNDQELINLKILDRLKCRESIRGFLVHLRHLCQFVPVRALMSDIQKAFETNYILNVAAVEQDLYKQLTLYQFRLSQAEDRPKHEVEQQKIGEITRKIHVATQKTDEARLFCAKYRVDM